MAVVAGTGPAAIFASTGQCPLEASITNKISIASNANHSRCGNPLYKAAQEGAPAMTKLYQRVREARKLTGLSQEQLAGEIGVSRGALAQWEMVDGTSPSVENLIVLAQRSGMAFEYLSTGRGSKIHGKPMLSVMDEQSDYQNLSQQQKRLLVAFEGLTPKQRSGLLDFLDSLLPGLHPRARG
jgi:transcriptional regulator with XRE-family HTH domain